MSTVRRRKTDIVVVVEGGVVQDVQFGANAPDVRVIVRDLDNEPTTEDAWRK